MSSLELGGYREFFSVLVDKTGSQGCNRLAKSCFHQRITASSEYSCDKKKYFPSTFVCASHKRGIQNGENIFIEHLVSNRYCSKCSTLTHSSTNPSDLGVIIISLVKNEETKAQEIKKNSS